MPQQITWPLSDAVSCSALDSEYSEVYTEAAIDYLWNVTGEKFGTYTEVVRPCRTADHRRLWSWSWNTVSLANQQLWTFRHGCFGHCTCSVHRASSIALAGPVVEVLTVRVDGTAIAPSEYRVEYGNVLVRDNGYWPVTQDLLKPASEPDTFEVTYIRGVPVPEGGQLAAAMLACELAKAYSGDNTCRLPQRLQALTRQGVTVGFMDTFEGLEEGRTGIWMIDSWISSVTRPHSVVTSPDVRVR